MKAFLFGAPIGILGGLIGLGGAEFRLPVLTGIFQYTAKRAVPINLAISLLTVLTALVTRISITSVEGLSPVLPIIMVLGVASMIGAYVGTAHLYRLDEPSLEKMIMVLLMAVGGLLISESLFVFRAHRLFDGESMNFLVEVALGFGIGIVSSLLGVAGGELIIPTLVLVFGIDIKDAGTASLLISTATIVTGFSRYYRKGAYADRRDISQVVIPMGSGSIGGAMIGAALLGIVSSGNLKLLLGGLLIVSAVNCFGRLSVTLPACHRRDV